MRFFNTAGPMIAVRHYQIPPLSRLDLEELERLIDEWRYFVLEVGFAAVTEARERLILRRDTHLDQLLHKLDKLVCAA